MPQAWAALLAFAAALCVAACAEIGDARSAEDAAAWRHLPEGSEWTGYVLEALDELGDDLLIAEPQDVGAFCPNFAQQDWTERAAFYVGLVSKMAEFESGFDPATSYTERFNDRFGQRVISRGLLQLSIESANAYPGCSLTRAAELHDPQTNIRCAVAILTRLVTRDALIGAQIDGEWRGGAAYWSVLRQTSPRRAPIEAHLAGLPFCRR
ncbi:MAG: transglycosylase SLT domain-containing protein [Pseudomonadota bacterium]